MFFNNNNRYCVLIVLCQVLCLCPWQILTTVSRQRIQSFQRLCNMSTLTRGRSGSCTQMYLVPKPTLKPQVSLLLCRSGLAYFTLLSWHGAWGRVRAQPASAQWTWRVIFRCRLGDKNVSVPKEANSFAAGGIDQNTPGKLCQVCGVVSRSRRGQTHWLHPTGALDLCQTGPLPPSAIQLMTRSQGLCFQAASSICTFSLASCIANPDLLFCASSGKCQEGERPLKAWIIAFSAV